MLEEKIRVLKIIDELPLIYDIYKLISGKNEDRFIVFENGTPFNPHFLPTDKELEAIDKKIMRRGNYGFIWPVEIFEKYGKRLIRESDLIHVYSQCLPIELYRFSLHKWNWAYYCYDNSIVRVFSKDERISGIIETNFQTMEDDYEYIIKEHLKYYEL